MSADPFDPERAFGGLKRLFGPQRYARLRSARVAVVGVGGVGSWAVEALARHGVARLVLIDLDHVSESNLNRQLQATVHTLGMAKVQALRERVASIHPGCEVLAVEEFVTASNWPSVLPVAVDGVIDACDQTVAKRVMAAWALGQGRAHVCVGAAGGKQHGERVAVADLAETTHDPLLASLRQRLRRDGAAPRQGRIGLRCVYSTETVQRPVLSSSNTACEVPAGELFPDAGTAAGLEPALAPASDLSCHGYGSSVVVTATFGMVAAGECIRQMLEISG